MSEKFMVPQVIETTMMQVETRYDGLAIVPLDVWNIVKDHLKMIDDPKEVKGFYGRLIASGHLDSTEWIYAETERECWNDLFLYYADNDERFTQFRYNELRVIRQSLHIHDGFGGAFLYGKEAETNEVFCIAQLGDCIVYDEETDEEMVIENPTLDDFGLDDMTMEEAYNVVLVDAETEESENV